MTAVRRPLARAAVLAVVGLATLAAGVLFWPNDSQVQDGAEIRPPASGTVTNEGECSRINVPSGSADARWPACPRPYRDDSPFNQRLGASPRLAADSSTSAAWLVKGGPIGHVVRGDSARDGGVPFYRSRPDDPLYTLHCLKQQWGRCEIEGARVRIPAAAAPAGVWPNQGPSDGHLTVVDPRTRMEFDLWGVTSKPSEGGRLNFAWGGSTSLDGNGLGSAAVAGQYGGLAGVIRADEFVSGRINHALALAVPCAEGVVYPAAGRGLSCADAGLPPEGAPPMGARFRLAISDKEIEALGIPRWQKGILRALAEYGAFVSDTSGEAGVWSFEQESGASYSSFGDTDPRIALARRLGISPLDYNRNKEPEYWMPYSDAIDWSRLQVIAPCVSRGTCR